MSNSFIKLAEMCWNLENLAVFEPVFSLFHLAIYRYIFFCTGLGYRIWGGNPSPVQKKIYIYTSHMPVFGLETQLHGICIMRLVHPMAMSTIGITLGVPTPTQPNQKLCGRWLARVWFHLDLRHIHSPKFHSNSTR